MIYIFFKQILNSKFKETETAKEKKRVRISKSFLENI